MMLNNNGIRKKIFSVIMSILIAITVFFAFLFWREMESLNDAYVDMQSIEYLSSSTQRLISLTLTNQLDQTIKFVISEDTNDSLSPHGSKSLSVFRDVKFVLLANEVIESWDFIEEELDIIIEATANKETPDYTNIALGREGHFKSMTNLSQAISDYSQELNDKISQYQAIIMSTLFAIAIVLINNNLRTHTELKIAKALAETAQLDTATGLFNRSRCQELFKTNESHSSKRNSAVLVLDLNDLKKTNDTLGHRAGDELICNFAECLKNATNVHLIAPFIGRYGGDEFVVYYEDIQGEEEITVFIKELNHGIREFNSKETRFKISYAVGYAFVSGEKDRMSVRQLFDKADEAMYENKIAVKKANNPEFEISVRGDT